MEIPPAALGIAISIGALLSFGYIRRIRVQRLKLLMEEARDAITRQDYVRAETILRKIMAIMPLWTHIRTALGESLARQGRLEEAEQSYRIAADLQPRNAAGHLELGLFYASYMPAERDKALGALTQAVSLDPELRRELMHDYRLTYLREDPRFLALVE